MNSETLRNELEALADRLSALRAEMAEATDVLAEVEHQLSEAQGRQVLTARAVADHEARVVAKKQELREAEREEAVKRRDEAAARLASAVAELLQAIEAHDSAVSDVYAMHGDRQPTLRENDELGALWERLKDAVRNKSNVHFDDERVEAAIQSGLPDAIRSLPSDLREVAHARMSARHRTRLERGS